MHVSFIKIYYIALSLKKDDLLQQFYFIYLEHQNC